MSHNFAIEPDLKLVDGAYDAPKAEYIFDHVLASLLGNEWQIHAHRIAANAHLSEKARNRVLIEAPIFIQFNTEKNVDPKKRPPQETGAVMEGYVNSRHRFDTAKEAEDFLQQLVHAKIDYLSVHMPEAKRDDDDATVEDINRQVECAEGRIKNLFNAMDRLRIKLREADTATVEINIPIKITVANYLDRKSAHHGSRAFT